MPPNRPRTPLLALGLLALAACSQGNAPVPDSEPEESADAAPATPAAGADAAAPASAAADAAPAPLGEHDPDLVHFHGYGAARFGDGEDPVRAAWGQPLQPYQLAGTTLCYYLEPDPLPEAGSGNAFMFEGGVFVRYDVAGRVPAAPGGFTVGARAADIKAAFGSRVEARPHPQLAAGEVLVVTPEYGEGARLVFEVDEQGRVSEWRIGLPPQVFYPRGCASAPAPGA